MTQREEIKIKESYSEFFEVLSQSVAYNLKFLYSW